MKTLLLIIISLNVSAQDCENIKEALERLSCYDEISINNKLDNKELDTLIIEARRSLVVNFKDPESAKFRNEIIYKNSDIESDQTACGEVNAKNSYGAYNGFKRYIYNSILFKLETTNSKSDLFNYQWLKYCSNQNKTWNIFPFYNDFLEKLDWKAANISNNGDVLLLRCSKREWDSPRIGVYFNNSNFVIGRSYELTIDTKESQIHDTWRAMENNLLMKMQSDKKIASLINSIKNNNSIEISLNQNHKSKFKLEGIQSIINKIKKQCPRKLKYWK